MTSPPTTSAISERRTDLALDHLGRGIVRHRRLVVILWLVLAVLGGVVAGRIFDHAPDVAASPAGSESALAAERLEAMDPEGPLVTAVVTGSDFFDPALVESATAVMYQVRDLPGVVDVTDSYTSGAPVGVDGQSALVVVELDRDLTADAAMEVATEVRDLLMQIAPAEVVVGGELLAEEAFVSLAVTETAIGEGVALALILVLLVAVLGGLRAGLLPIISALVAVAVALLGLVAVLGVLPVNEFAVNIVTILGLGLSVDYALLVLARFREERARLALPREMDLDQAAEVMGVALQHAGRAVVTSGAAVFIALAGLLLLGDELLAGMAAGGAVVVLVATAAALTLLPALLAMARRDVPEPRTRSSQRTGLLARSATFAQRRPGAVALVTTALLVVLAVPLTSLTLGSSDLRSLPAQAPERLALDRQLEQFPDLSAFPLTVMVQAPLSDAAVPPLLDAIVALDGVAAADLDSQAPDELTVLEVTAEGEASGRIAQDLVRSIRQTASEASGDDGDGAAPAVQVAGVAAEVVDTTDTITQRLPWTIALVVIATFLLLAALTGSLVVPLKALLLNALTLAATLGVLVAIFQWGWGADLLGFTPWGALDVVTPLLVGMLAFGLSMDYQVFLLARITEEWRARQPATDARRVSDQAVLAGLTSSGRVVTVAALAIGIVFLAFASGSLIAMKEVGIGMALAVLIDVTVVRGLLMPATMSLLGRWSWWPDARGGRRRVTRADSAVVATPPTRV